VHPTILARHLAVTREVAKQLAISLFLTLLSASIFSDFSYAQSQTASSAHAIAAAVDSEYNHLSTLQAEFTEIYQGAGMERTESGTLWLKKPGKMLWQYRSPREKVFVSDGKTAWFYVPGDRQARRTPVKNLEDLRSPLRFLLGKTKLEKELNGLSFAPDVPPIRTGDVVLRGAPKALGDQVSQVLLEITPEHLIDRIVLDQTDGSTTEYRFSDQKENIAVADQRFRFSPPAGVEVVEGELGSSTEDH
jgi:outer membrane lipoprotein carrier protein